MATIGLRTFVGDVQPSLNCPIGTIWIDTSSTPAVKVCSVENTTFVAIGTYGGNPASGLTYDAPVITGAITRTSQSFILNAADGWAADAAGWVAPTTVAETAVRLPASKTALKWIVPITGVHIGDIITGYKVNGQAESGGNAYTLDCDIYESTMAAGDITEASKSAAITQVTGTADAIIAATKASLAITVTTAKPLYFILTGTTAASTDLAVASIELTVTQK